MDHFRKTTRSVIRHPENYDALFVQSPQQSIKPLRLKYNDVCTLLNVSRDYLRKIIASDESFPKALKNGNSRQSSVYFDTEELEAWYQNYKKRCRGEI